MIKMKLKKRCGIISRKERLARPRSGRGKVRERQRSEEIEKYVRLVRRQNKKGKRTLNEKNQLLGDAN